MLLFLSEDEFCLTAFGAAAEAAAAATILFKAASYSAEVTGGHSPLVAARTNLGATRGSVNANRLIERLRLRGGTKSGLDVREKAPES